MSLKLLQAYYRLPCQTQLVHQHFKYISTKISNSATVTSVTSSELQEVEKEVQNVFNNNNNNNAASSWIRPDTKPNYEEQDLPVHGCLTREENNELVKKSIFQYNPEFEKLDPLPKHEWRGVFQLFLQSEGIRYDAIKTINTIFGGEGTSRKMLYDDLLHKSKLEDQKILPARVKALGPDLAAAYFAIYRGARVRFHGKEEWYVKDKFDECELPKFEEPGWNLKEVDASKMSLYYPGLENFKNCNSLDTLKLFGNKNVDNFFLDRICHQHSNSLQVLDISYCPRITIGGITSLVRLKKLKRFVVAGLKIPHLALACMTLEDELPGLDIVGLNFEGKFSKLSDKEIEAINDSLTPQRLNN